MITFTQFLTGMGHGLGYGFYGSITSQDEAYKTVQKLSKNSRSD